MLRLILTCALSLATLASATPAPGPIVLFSANDCSYCAAAKAHLAERKLAYSEKNIEKSAEARAEFSRLGGTVVPLILVGGQRVVGYTAPQLDEALAAAGY